MSNAFSSPVIAVVAALLSVASIRPAYAIESYHDYINRASTQLSISARDGDLGEQLSQYNGSTAFAVTDVALPGNSSLPVSIGRTHRAGSEIISAPGLFGQWDIDLPHLHGIFASGIGWQVSTDTPQNRCSSVGTAAAMKPLRVAGNIGNTSNDDFDGEEYWSGYRLRMPGGGDDTLLLASTSLSVRPQGSADYRWATTGQWYFRCLPTLKNATGEGFLAIAPDGTRYYFDWMVARVAFPMEKPVRLGSNVFYSNLGRQKVMLYPSRIEDRFGHWVSYQWSGSQLYSIQASDGRTLTMEYVAVGSGASARLQVSTVSDGARTWRYAYDVNGGLTSLTLPDGAKWTFNMQLATVNYQANYTQSGNDGCTRSVLPEAVRNTYTITQPSGLTVEYTFAPRVHSRSRVFPKCSWSDSRLEDQNKSPGTYYYVLSLIQKKIYGPGVPERTWTFRYSSGQQGGSWYDCYSCPTTKTTEVTDSAGRFTRYTFSNYYAVSEGRLLKVETGADANTLVTTETYQYDTPLDTPYPSYIRQYGAAPPYRAVDALEGVVVPLRSATIIREGTAFTRTVQAYDVFARPLRVLKNTSLGTAKTDATEYHDDPQLWVLGQVLSERNVDTGTVLAATEYNAQALPSRTFVFGKLQQTLTYWPSGLPSAVTDGRDNVTTYSDYHRGIPRLIGYADGSSESATVNDQGWVTSVTDETGAKTCYGYDAMGRLSNLVYPSETQTGICDATRWYPQTIVFQQIGTEHYGLPAGHWRSSTYHGGKHVHVHYDAMWRPVVEETFDAGDVLGTLSQVVKRYDNSGRLAFVSYPQRGIAGYQSILQGTRTLYDALDRIVRVEQDSEHGVLATTSEYLPGLQIRTTDARGLQTTTAYMAWDGPNYDLPILSQQPEGKVVQIDRHPQFGWPLALTQRNTAGTLSQTRRYVYDAHAQLCKTIEPETGATLMSYDGAGNLAWSAAGLNLPNASAYDAADPSVAARKVLRSYDARNRLSTLAFPDGRGDQVWTYTPDGLPSTITTFNGPGNTIPVVNAYAYNARRLLAGQGESITQPGWYAWGIGYGYDALGHLAAHTYPTGLVVDYAPNALGQATKAGVFASGAQYHPNGALKQFMYGNGLVHTMEQNARQLPLRVRSGTQTVGYEYWYDFNGNPKHIHDLVRGSSYSRLLQYDGLDRLTDAGSASFGGNHWHHLRYDALDNITSWTGVKDYAEYGYDAQNRLTNIRNSAGATVVELSYDAQGNLSNKNGRLHSFDYGNRLREVIGHEYYRYDGHGRRAMTGRPTDFTLYQYSQAGQMLFEQPSAGANKAHVYLAGSLVATHSSDGTTVYSHTDALGSPVAVTNQTGQVIERHDYEPYGAIIGKPSHSGIGYTGHVMDGGTGLTYMQQRYYDQSVGRFLSVDPVTANSGTGANFNRYWYANNNPYRFTDPDGRQSRETVRAPSTGIPLLDWLMTPSDARGSQRQMMEKQLASELSQKRSWKDVVRYVAIAMSAGTGAAGQGVAVNVTARAAGIADDALVVRAGSGAGKGANTVEGLAKGISTHPTAGVTGFSAESANGASLCLLCSNMPRYYNQVGVTTAGAVRAAGGDVISTPGVSPTHATVTGLSPEAANRLLTPTIPNPLPKPKEVP